mgnify:CR=1 FL=1
MAVEAGVPAIMAAHVALAEEDGLPVTMSGKVIRELLRGELAFDGLAVSDCMLFIWPEGQLPGLSSKFRRQLLRQGEPAG